MAHERVEATYCTCDHLLEYHPPLQKPGTCAVKGCTCEGFELDTEDR